MTKITILSGFGQEPETLKNVFNNKDVVALDYLQNKNFEDLLTRDLKAYDNEIIIGWSLGGQVAIRLIEKQILKPKLLILLATPFQYIEGKQNKIGKSLNDFLGFENLLNQSPEQALILFAQLSASNDNNFKEVLMNMNGYRTVYLQNWLQELKDFSCFDVNFKNFPKTVYICGDNDAVVDSAQYEYFIERIADFELQIIFNCGHAPHFSHKNEFLNIINEKI